MIIDRIENSQRVEVLHPYFKLAFDYLKTHDLLSLAPGRVDLAGNEAYLKVEESQGRTWEEARLERHEQYIDIQVPLVGKESYGWTPLNDLKEPLTPYRAENDCMFYGDACAITFPLSFGQFVVFFPEDAHAPCIAEGYLRKIVIKIKL